MILLKLSHFDSLPATPFSQAGLSAVRQAPGVIICKLKTEFKMPLNINIRLSPQTVTVEHACIYIFTFLPARQYRQQTMYKNRR